MADRGKWIPVRRPLVFWLMTLLPVIIGAAMLASWLAGAQYSYAPARENTLALLREQAPSSPPQRGLASESSTSPESLQDLFDQLGMGNIVYNPPAEMPLGAIETISVRIYRKAAPKPSDAPLAGNGPAVTETIRVGPTMAVSLSGDNFDIQGNSNRKQFVPAGGFAEWIFHVKPVAGGVQTLILQASAVLDNDGTETELPSISRQITVKVSTLQRIAGWVDPKDIWGWFWSAVGAGLVAAAGYFVKRWWDARHPKPSGES